jgi:16S rRNA (guanine966-N2)-methyltransferase
MRIIGGNFKGKRILDPQDKETRPLKDLAKESIFNILKHSNKFSIKIENSIILDLFSGVGSFGLECLSRGARYVTFVENYSGVLPILKRNLSNLKIEGKYQVINDNILNNIDFKKIINKYDIIFLDPPYKEKKLPIIIDQISRDKILSDDGIVIIHRHKKEEDQFTKKFKILVEKKYGISKILFGKLD